jgi:uncharacterized protein (DUF2336 family)
MLPILDELEGALDAGSATRRSEILTKVTDLFIHNAAHYSEDQVVVFDDVMELLIRRIEAEARVRLAHRLASIANAPSNVVHLLAFDDDIEVARPILLHSERVNDHTLIATAGMKSQEHLFAISQRRAVSEAVTDILVERGDPEVVHAVVKNRGARFSAEGFSTLVERSNGDDALAGEVGMRVDIPRPQLLELLERASQAVRARLVSENPLAAAVIDEVVAEVTGGVRALIADASPDPAEVAAPMDRHNHVRRISEAEVYLYARSGKFEETAMALAGMCETPIDVVERALLDPGTEIALILAKVAELSATTTRAVLLLRSSECGLSADDLDEALATYDRLQPETARRVLGFFRTRTKIPVELASSTASPPSTVSAYLR